MARYAVIALVCWGGLLGGAALLIFVKNNEAEAARAPHPPLAARLSPQEIYLWRHFPSFRDAVPVLAYHTVDAQKNYLAVSRHQFAKQLHALRVGGFHTITIQQYVRFEKTGSTAGLPSKPILLTFDDGRLDAYQGADRILAEYRDTAVMFVVASWPEAHSEWSLHWNELVHMQQSGTWEIQEHAGRGHTHIPVDPHGRTGEYYAYRGWSDGHLESFTAYKKRASHDVLWGEKMLKEHIPGYKPLAFAVPYSNYGQRFTNDTRIPWYFLPFLHTQFPAVFDGDYLDEGTGRPAEIKGRWSPQLSYRITQGPAMELPELYCRLRDYVLGVPVWREYGCLKRSHVPSVYSE